ncbi:hypothetical protein H6G54_29805 [Anabaena cylindrica FACHB-243]|uniref:Uncharacterized protein n=1 Tax=Anabaena cylindrica (strain ATCC 27899 / PCC 7122) TaxID=272123 RepID=K9ZPE8_ANACC|nr:MULTISPECIES: hypothetical protein [Anabaena]AFZ61076.1 hypothetical protein Anacy_5775 [Anabaena cylindrica PCC 7122]MBD2421796.1 hypothetical protein [Anabaena cylindrica FACHB-243]MBY5284580.1 hypothetical protein [Anabaena sp. CCAP 1446/1C]MBY5306433.1 hypothetical protein [Anabaena sp. CCAP 1446/1C]MCM2408053.1 hypothetical protein [Anabaena sp. CCAP 1446/1C]
MSQTLITQEFGIIIAAKNHKPTILNPDFLKYSGIVPIEWELARQPIYTQSVSQVAFTNGIAIIAEPTRVMFIEAIENKAVEEIAVPAIAKKYVEALPNVEYEAVGINPRGYISFDQQQDAARLFLTETLLASGAWQEVGTAPVRATLNLAYTLERGPFYLSINEAALRNPDETSTPILLFSGSFSYEVKSETPLERKSSLHQALDNWQADLSAYQEIISTKFLGKISEDGTLLTNVFAMSNAV